MSEPLITPEVKSAKVEPQRWCMTSMTQLIDRLHVCVLVKGHICSNTCKLAHTQLSADFGLIITIKLVMEIVM